jgi:hypothetical protein
MTLSPGTIVGRMLAPLAANEAAIPASIIRRMSAAC